MRVLQLLNALVSSTDGKYLPIPYYVYEKLGFPGLYPGNHVPDMFDPFKENQEEMQDEGQDGEKDPNADGGKEEEDPYGNEEGQQEEEQDPNAQEEEAEDNYYKVGEEEKEMEREHESFAVFREKEKDEMSSEGQEAADLHYHQYHTSLSSENSTQETNQDTQDTYTYYYYNEQPQYAHGSYNTPQESAWNPFYQTQGEENMLQESLGHVTNGNRRIFHKKRPGYRRTSSRRPVLHRSSSSSSFFSSFPFNLFS